MPAQAYYLIQALKTVSNVFGREQASRKSKTSPAQYRTRFSSNRIVFLYTFRFTLEYRLFSPIYCLHTALQVHHQTG